MGNTRADRRGIRGSTSTRVGHFAGPPLILRALDDLSRRVTQVLDGKSTGVELGAMALRDHHELPAQAVADPLGEQRGTVVRSLAPANRDLAAVEVDILDPEAEALEQAEAAAVEKLSDEAERGAEVLQEGQDVTGPEDRGEVVRPARSLKTHELGHRELEDVTVQEEDGAESLVLRGGRDVALASEIVEECGDLGGAQVAGMATRVKADEGADPVEVRLLGARPPSCRRRRLPEMASRRVMARPGLGWRAGMGRGPWRYRRERDSSCADFVEGQRGGWHESCVDGFGGRWHGGCADRGGATVGKHGKSAGPRRASCATHGDRLRSGGIGLGNGFLDRLRAPIPPERLRFRPARVS
jgi:hypothetical protein